MLSSPSCLEQRGRFWSSSSNLPQEQKPELRTAEELGTERIWPSLSYSGVVFLCLCQASLMHRRKSLFVYITGGRVHNESSSSK